MDANDVNKSPCDIDIKDPTSRHPKEVKTICEEIPMVVAEFPGATIDTSSEQDCKERELLSSTCTSTQLNTGLVVSKNEIQLAYLPPKIDSLGIVQTMDSQSEAPEGVDTNSEINELRTPLNSTDVSTILNPCGAGVVSESSYLMSDMTGVQNSTCPDDSDAGQPMFQSSDNPPEFDVDLEIPQGKAFHSPAVKCDPSNEARNGDTESTVAINLCDGASDTPNNSEDDDESCNDTGAVAESCVRSDGMPSLSSVFENTSLLISLNSQTVDVETVKSIILRLKKGRVSVLDDAAAYVAGDITYKVKLVLQEATKFMQMSKRRRLRPADIDHAVRLVNSELPLFGIGVPPSLSKCKTSGTGEKSSFLVDKRQIVSYGEAAAEMEAAQVPRETVVHEHWLHLTEEEDAVHIPWINTNLNPQNSHEGKEGESPNDVFTAAANSEDATEAIQVDPTFSDDNCKNLSLSSLALRCHLQKPKTFVYNELIHLRGQSYGLLTKELEIYFREIKSACFGACEDSRALAFQSLQHDPNISKMVSHLCSFISRKTVKYVANPNLRNLSTIMRMLHHILLNKYILNMKLFLHEVLPAIVTCIVCSTISQSSEYEDHWKLRDYGAELLKFVCDKYSSPINNIQGRAVAVFQKALQNKELDFAAVYGSLRALKVLGVAAVGTDMVQTEAKIKQRVDEFLSRSGSLTDKQRRNAIRIQDHFKAQQTQLATVTTVVVKNTSKVKPKTIPKDQGPKQEPPKIKEECTRPQPQLSPWRMAVPRKSPHPASLSKLPVIGTTIDGVPFKPMPIPRFPQSSTANNPIQMTEVHNQSQQSNITQGMHLNSENTFPLDNKIRQHGHSTKTGVDHTHAPIEDISGGSSSGIYLQNSSHSMQAFSAPNFHDYSLKQYRVVRPLGSGDVSRVQGGGNSNRKLQSCVRNPGAEVLLRSPSEISGNGRCETPAMMNSRLPAPRFKTLASPRLLPPRRGTVPLSGAASIIAAGTHAYTEEDLAKFSSIESTTTPATHYTLQQVNGEFYLQPVYVSGAVRPRLLSSPRGNADTGAITVRQQHQASPDLARGSNCTVSGNIVDTSTANQASSPSASSQVTSSIVVPPEQTSLVASQSAQNLLAGTDTGSKIILDKLVIRENQEGQ